MIAIIHNKKKNYTRKEGELSSSDATISWVGASGFHCKTDHLFVLESDKL